MRETVTHADSLAKLSNRLGFDYFKEGQEHFFKKKSPKVLLLLFLKQLSRNRSGLG